jgi:VWFA-related protein
MRRTLWKFILLVSVFLGTSLFPLAQSESSNPGATLKLTSRSVLVDVVVEDGKGEPVLTLPQKHFEVLEDGKPQKIDFFEEHKGRAIVPGALPPLPAMPPNVYTNVPPAPLSDSVNILLLDTLNTPPQDFSYARNEMIQFLHNVTPGTRLAIVTLGSKLTYVTGFTTDASTLLAATEKPSGGDKLQLLATRHDETLKNSAIAMRQESAGGHPIALGADALTDVFSEENAYNARMRELMTIEALQELSKHLASVPGRKNLLWFSSEFPVHFFPVPGDRGHGDIDTMVGDSVIRKAADALTEARIAIYPIDARGVIRSEVIAADSRGIDQTGNGKHVGMTDSMEPYTRESSKIASQIMGMNQLASETGGKASYNTNDLNASTQRAIADGAHYYTLAYTPTNRKMDGRFRRIEVKLVDSGLKLRYRQGYNAIEDGSANVIDTAPLRNFIRPGVPAATEILYAARVAAVDPQPAANTPLAGKNTQLNGPKIRYSVDFFIRWSDLKLDARPDGAHAGRIQIELLAYDRQGMATNWIGGTLQMALKTDAYAAVKKSGVPAHMEIDLPANQETLLETGAYDWQTAKAGTLEIRIQAGTAK